MAGSSAPSPRPASTVVRVARPGRPSHRTCVSTPPRQRRNRRVSGRACAAVPTPHPGRRSGTCAPTSWREPCGSSVTASSTARVSRAWRRLGYSTRQLNRLITAEVGTGPLALARAQRSQTARVLLETTDLPVVHVAFAAGFASVRQCNETVRAIFADTPTGLRGRAAQGRAGAPLVRHRRHPVHPLAPALPPTVQPGLGPRLPGRAGLAGRRAPRRHFLPAQPSPPPRARGRDAHRARDAEQRGAPRRRGAR